MKVYLDNAATTKQDEAVTVTVMQCLQNAYANPSSVHSMGQAADAYLENAREICAGAINAAPDEIVFTSGGTESDNSAILGFCLANRDKGNHIVTSEIEHHAVLASCWKLESLGFDVTYVKPDADGIIRPEEIAAAVRNDTLLISVMYVNNEIGTVQDIASIGQIAKEKKIAFHTDAVQAFCKLDTDVEAMGIDMMSVSAHKFHGPKGTGFLYIKKGLAVDPLLLGGGQERGLRSGTVNVPQIAGMGRAVQCALDERKTNEARIKEMRDMLCEKLMRLNGVSINGCMDRRIADNLNVCIEGVETDALLYMTDLGGVCISAGSACAAGTLRPSHVIKAIGKDGLGASARLTLSKYTTFEEIDYAARILNTTVEKIRSRT